MFSFEVQPVFRGTTYTDELQMIDADTGAALPFDPTIDDLVFRLQSADRLGSRGSWFGSFGDYAQAGAPRPWAMQNDASVLTLLLGAGLSITPAGTALWVLSAGQTYALRHPEYRMTLDLLRYGETCRVMDTTLTVER